MEFSHARRRRAQAALGAVCVLLGALTLTFFHTQVVGSTGDAAEPHRTRLRPLTLPADRGVIVDREGRILAENVPAYTLSLLPAATATIRTTLERLQPLLGLSDAEVASVLERRRRREQQLVVATDVPFDVVSAIEERRPLFPEVLIEMRPKRRYPAGPAAAHLLGYVGEPSEQERRAGARTMYRPGAVVGKAGVERQYDPVVAGVAGVRYVEVDTYGRVVREYRRTRSIPSVPGRDLRLHVDLALQEWIAGLVPDRRRGAVVALEPTSGAVLALYSSPSFDPNDLAAAVGHDRSRDPGADSVPRLLDRSIAAGYSPGSTWTLATAAVALKLGIVDPRATMPLACRGGMRYGGRYFRCWLPEGHGALDLPDAIGRSCDVYFYQLGLQIGLERLLAEGARLGFGESTGVDLPAERPGTFPADAKSYRRRLGVPPTEAEALSVAIGEGANEQTVLKMAHFFAALATDGRAPPPRLAADTVVPGGKELDLGLAAEDLEWLRAGLRRATAPGGTAHGSALEHWDWMGKTGSARNRHGPDHAWFVGIAGRRGGEPELVVAAIMEGGTRGPTAAQVAASAADYYLRKRHGMPIESIQRQRAQRRAGRGGRGVTWR